MTTDLLHDLARRLLTKHRASRAFSRPATEDALREELTMVRRHCDGAEGFYLGLYLATVAPEDRAPLLSLFRAVVDGERFCALRARQETG